jgi:GNAT superfamily N-acetyltransferase
VRAVDAGNLEAVLKLEVAAGQRALVAPAARSLAQAAYEPASRALALCDGPQVVGLLLLYDARQDPLKPAPQLYVWRLMIDAAHQRRGLGRRAMQWVEQEARRMGMASVGLSHVQQPGHAGAFYAGLGFRYTGEVVDGEHKMVLELVPQ